METFNYICAIGAIVTTSVIIALLIIQPFTSKYYHLIDKITDFLIVMASSLLVYISFIHIVTYNKPKVKECKHNTRSYFINNLHDTTFLNSNNTYWFKEGNYPNTSNRIELTIVNADSVGYAKSND